MVLSPEDYKASLGVPVSMPDDKLSEHLLGMIVGSIGSYMANLEVVVLGTVVTQDLQLQVSTKALQEIN